MKIKDYVYFANQDLQAKKSYKKIIISSVIAQVILTICLFLFLSIEKNISTNLNKKEETKIFDVKTSHLESDALSNFLINRKYLSNIKESKGLTDIITYNTYNASNVSSIKIGDNLEQLSNLTFSIIDGENTKNYFTKFDYKTVKSPLICGDEFSNNSKNEIMISNSTVKYLGLNPLDVISKKITIMAKYFINDSDVSYSFQLQGNKMSDDYENKEYSLLKDFNIVGIFDDKIYSSKNQSRNKQRLNDFWITTDSLAISDDICYPKSVPTENLNGRYSEYHYDIKPEELEQQALNLNYIYLPLGLGVSILGNINYSHPLDEKCFLYYCDFKDGFNAYNGLCDLIKKSQGSSSSSVDGYVINRYMSDIAEYYPIYSTITMCLIVFSIVIFIMNFANLINTIYYETIEKRHYYGLLRAIGMDNRSVKLISFVKTFILQFKSFIIAFIFSFILCLVIKFYIEDNFSIEIEDYALNLNFVFYFLAVLIVNLFINFIYFILSFLLSYKLTAPAIVKSINAD